jgi:hypothetical protein
MFWTENRNREAFQKSRLTFLQSGIDLKRLQLDPWLLLILIGRNSCLLFNVVNANFC